MEPGFVFPSADHDLTDVYLAGEIAGRPVVSAFVHRADVYSAVPAELVSGLEPVRDRDGNEAYFLYTPVRYAGKSKTQRQRRIDGDPRKSYWHSEARKIPLEGSKTGGYVQDFAHAIKGADGLANRLGWRMKEYGVTTEHGDSDLVVCKVYRTPYRNRKAISSKKRKGADGAYYSEDSTPSARPRLTDQLHPPMAEPAESAADELFKMYCELTDDDERIRAAIPNVAPDPMVDPDGYIVGEALQEIDASKKKAAQPEPAPEGDGFFQSMEQELSWPPAAQPEEEDATGLVETIVADDQILDAILGEEGAHTEPEWDMEQEFPFFYPNNDEEAATPWPAAAQPEEDASTGLVETIAADDQMDAILGQEGAHPEPEPDEPASDEIIYGLPCPAFSPEMILKCSDDVMTPWPSPSSMSMIFFGDLY